MEIFAKHVTFAGDTVLATAPFVKLNVENFMAPSANSKHALYVPSITTAPFTSVPFHVAVLTAWLLCVAPVVALTTFLAEFEDQFVKSFFWAFANTNNDLTNTPELFSIQMATTCFGE